MGEAGLGEAGWGVWSTQAGGVHELLTTYYLPGLMLCHGVHERVASARVTNEETTDASSQRA